MTRNLPKRMIWIVVLLIVALLSAFVMAPIMRSPDHHADTIAALDEKKMTVMELTAAMVTASVVIAAVPGDATDPVADQIMNLTSWLMTVVGVLFLEKFLVTVLGHAAFLYIVPIACGIAIIALLLDWESLRRLAMKLGIFGVILSLIIPVSVNISNIFDATYEASIQETIDMVQEEELELEEQTVLDQSWIDSLVTKLENGITDLTHKGEELIARGKQLLNNFIDSVAVLMITTCVIPIGTIMVSIWLAKLLFGLQFNLPKQNPIDIRKVLRR